MSPRGGDRTPEEREAARRERQRRRLERAGEPIPPELLEPAERPADAADPFAAEPEPAWSDPPADAAAPAESPAPVEPAGHEPAAPAESLAPVEPPAHEPAAPAHEPEPHPSPVALHHDAEPQHDPDATQQWDVTEAWLDEQPASEGTREHAAADAAAPAAAAEHTTEHAIPEPPSAEHEVPLGTRRVSGQERMHLPHIHRPGRGGKRNRSERLPKGRGVRVKRPGEVPTGSRRRRSWAGRVLALGAVAVVAVVVWFLISLFQPFGGGGDGTGRVVVKVPQGASTSDIGKLLADRGVVSSSFFFNLRAKLSGDGGDLKSGTFKLRRDMSYAAALDRLTHVAPPPPTVSVTVPEGRSRRETRAIAAQAGLRGDYLAATRRSRLLNPRSYGAPANATLEGFLFPATYDVRRGANVSRLVDQQLKAFRRNFKGVDLSYARSKQLTPYDVLIIASMVEREVSVPRERPVVAAVIYNRLRDSMPLGIDATLRFEQNDWTHPLTESVLETDTPYNTRTRQGLPPGPIGSPGLASIKAAAHPARSPALYYVVKPCGNGEHVFSNSIEQFNQDVARYNAARTARGGRSPTQC